MVASGMSNIAYYGVLGVGVGLSLLEMFVEIIDLFVKKDLRPFRKKSMK